MFPTNLPSRIDPGGSIPGNRNPSGPTMLDDLSVDEEELHSTPLTAPPYNLSQSRSQSRLYSPVRSRPAISQTASSSHFVVMVPPPELRADALPARSATIASHARRGILLPLYPTLGGQLYALVREYGLPSVGGISVYLLDDGSGGLGPRIGDATWAALWSGFFDDEEMDDTGRDSDADLSRPSPLPYARRHTPTSPRRVLPRVPSNASFSSTRSTSAATFALEMGRLPIVGRFEWAVDPQRARWWSAYVQRPGDEAVQSTADAPPTLPSSRLPGNAPRPLRLTSQSSPALSGRAASREAPQAPSAAPSAESNTRDVFDSVPAPTTSLTDGPPTSAPYTDAPEERGPTEKAPDAADDTVVMLGTPFDNEQLRDGDAGAASGRDHQADMAREGRTSATSARSERADVRDGRSSAASTRSERAAPSKDEHRAPEQPKEHHTMSSTVASISAAASRFFGGRSSEDKAHSPELAPAKPAFSESDEKPQTPTSPMLDVEEARERVTEMERHSAQARRHTQRASVEVPRSVRRASARISEAIGARSTPPLDTSRDDTLDDRALDTTGSGAGSNARYSRHRPSASVDRMPIGQHSVARKSIVRPPQRPMEGDIFNNMPKAEGVSSAENAQRRMGHQPRQSLRSPIVLENQQLDSSSRFEPLVDPVQLSRQSSLEFDNTLGDLQRALELLSPRQRNRTSQDRKRGSGLMRNTSIDSVQADGKPASRRLFVDSPAKQPPAQTPDTAGLSPSAPVADLNAYVSPRPDAAWAPERLQRQEPWLPNVGRDSVQMPAVHGAQDAPSVYAMPDVQPLNVRKEAVPEASPAPNAPPAPATGEALVAPPATDVPEAADAADSVGHAMQQGVFDAESVRVSLQPDAPPPLPPKDPSMEPLEDVLEGMHAPRPADASQPGDVRANPAARAHENFPPRAEDDWAKWTENAEEPANGAHSVAPAPALRVAEDTEQYVPESSVRMSTDAEQYVRVSQAEYIRPGSHEFAQSNTFVSGVPPPGTLGSPAQNLSSPNPLDAAQRDAPQSSALDASMQGMPQPVQGPPIPGTSMQNRPIVPSQPQAPSAPSAPEPAAFGIPEQQQQRAPGLVESNAHDGAKEPGTNGAVGQPGPLQAPNPQSLQPSALGETPGAPPNQGVVGLAGPPASESAPQHLRPHSVAQPEANAMPQLRTPQPDSNETEYDSLMPTNQAQFSPNSNEQSLQGRTTPPGEPQTMSAMSPMSPNTSTSKPSAFSLTSRSPRRLRHSASSDRLQTSPPSSARGFLAKMSPKLKWGRRKKTGEDRKVPSVSAPISAMPLPPSEDLSESDRNPARNSTASISSVNKGHGLVRPSAPYFDPTTLVRSPNFGSAGEGELRELEQPNPIFRMGGASASVPTLALHNSPGDVSVSQLQSPFQGSAVDANTSDVFPAPAADLPSPELHQSALGTPGDRWAAPGRGTAEAPSLPPSNSFTFDDPQTNVPQFASQDLRPSFSQGGWGDARPRGPDPARSSMGAMHPVNMPGATPAVAPGIGTGANAFGDTLGAWAGGGAGGAPGNPVLPSGLPGGGNVGQGALNPSLPGALPGGAANTAGNLGPGPMQAAGNLGHGAMHSTGQLGQGTLQGAGQMGGAAVNTAGNLGHGTMNTAGNLGQGTMHTAGNLGQDTLHATGNIGDGAMNTAGNLGHGAVHTAGSVGNGAFHSAGQLGQGATGAVGHAGDSALHGAEGALHNAEDGASHLAKKFPGLDKLSGTGGKESSGKGMLSSLTPGAFRKG